jgi:hypothetical protein
MGQENAAGTLCKAGDYSCSVILSAGRPCSEDRFRGCDQWISTDPIKSLRVARHIGAAQGAGDVHRFSSTQPSDFVALRLRHERTENPKLRLRKGYELFRTS